MSLVLAGALVITSVFVPGQQTDAKAKVKLNKKKLVLTVGKKAKLKVKGTKKKVKWSSSKKKIATVTKKGVVKAKKKGTAKIVAKIGKKKYTCKVVVKAKKKGTTIIRADGDISVTNASGEKFSMWSNQVAVSVVKKKKKTGNTEVQTTPKATNVPVVTAPPVKSKENRLKTLKLDAVSMMPEFSPEVTAYEATVDANSDSLYYSYALQDEKARVSVRGGENLSEGNNDVSFVVTAEDGSVREYKVMVTKETKEETESREDEADTTQSVGFVVEQKGDKKIIKNSYEFEVANPDDLERVPEGYIQSSVVLSGVTVPAFTMEHDLDNNYLLLYLKPKGGDAALYQYDRTEQTIQKYTGTMVERVNKGETADDSGSFPISTTVLMAVIIVLIVTVLSLLIAMLKMAMKRRDKKGKELDF